MSLRFKNPVVLSDNTILEEELQRVADIAKGRTTGYVFATKAELDAAIADEEFKSKLLLGDNLYITAKNVPDYWWDGAQIQELETAKVDLTEYVKNTDYASANTGGVIKTFSGYGTMLTSGTLGAYTRTAAQYATDVSNLFIGKGTLENLKEAITFTAADGTVTTLNMLK